MRLVEGGYHCPAISDDLVEATRELRAGTIDLATYKDRIRERAAYRMRTKQLPIAGQGERLTCPAAGPAPTAKCALKPASTIERPTRQTNGLITDARLRIIPPADLTASGAPKVCAHESVAVTISDGAKFRQSLPYASPTQTSLYNTLRQSQEGLHGFAKDDAHECLGTPCKRRVRGKAAQSVFAAFLLAAAAIRKIRTFLATAVEDPRTAAVYVVRKPRTGEHATTDLPPGVGPPEVTAA